MSVFRYQVLIYSGNALKTLVDMLGLQRLKSDVSSALSLGRLFQQYTSQISATLMR